MSALKLPDAEARRRAAHDFAANLVVVAGAGTGKTSLLVERALSAMGRGFVDIGQLAAITFTEKAAGEMRTRLADGLERLRCLARGEAPADKMEEADRAYRALVESEALPAGDVAARALAALQALDRARITTIHAFCADLLREHPVQARIAPDYVVDEGEHSQALFDVAWAAFLADELGDGGRREAAWRELLADVPLGHLRETARLLAGFAVPGSLLQDPARADVAALFREEALLLEGALEDVRARALGLSPLPSGYLGEALEALRALCEEGIDALRAQVARSAVLRRDVPPGPNKKLQGVEPREFRDRMREAHHLIGGLARLDEERFERMIEVLTPFARAFRETMLRAGFVSFDGLLALARDLLRDHPAVRERVKRRYRMLLLDEFQDTDPLQYEIVLFLAEVEGGRARDPFEAELAPGRLFVVGDPKQSIYRFRGADYSAFIRAIERIARPEDRLHLIANFRSRPEVLAPVNELLGAASGAWRPSAYQPDYEAIAPMRPVAEDGERVELWTVDAGPGATAERRREAEGKVIASEIRRMVAAGEYKHGDILVLLRAFTRLPLYLRPLREAGIPFVVDGGRELLERTEVVQLVSVLRALARRSDPVALLGFLRSAAGAVPDDELAAYAGGVGEWSWGNRVDPEVFPRIARAFEMLRRIDAATGEMSGDAAIRHILAETHLLPLGAFGFEGAQRVANLRKVAAVAAELAREGRLTPNEILDALERERLPDLEGESPLADETWESVRILTIHKAKGLENKVVFVPDLAREEVHGGFRAPVELRAVQPPGLPTLLAVRADRSTNAARLWHEGESRRHEAAEEVRTLYVALTRPREKLILLGGPSKRRAPWVEALRVWGYDPDAPPDDGAILGGGVRHRLVTPEAERASRREAPAAAALGDPVARWESAVARLRGAGVPFDHPSGLHEEEESRRDAEARGLFTARPARGRAQARAVGRVVHRALELWDRGDDRSLLQAAADHARGVAGEERLRPGDVATEARAVLEAFLRSALAVRLRKLDVVGREVPILLREDDGRSWRGSIDLLYRDAGGGVVVADYKTDPDPAGAADRYGDQLRVYGEAVRRALGLDAPPRTELWMVRAGEIVPIDPSSAGGGEPPDDDPLPLFRNL